jgi:hypothetical protein
MTVLVLLFGDDAVLSELLKSLQHQESYRIGESLLRWALWFITKLSVL